MELLIARKGEQRAQSESPESGVLPYLQCDAHRPRRDRRRQEPPGRLALDDRHRRHRRPPGQLVGRGPTAKQVLRDHNRAPREQSLGVLLLFIYLSHITLDLLGSIT